MHLKRKRKKNQNGNCKGKRKHNNMISNLREQSKYAKDEMPKYQNYLTQHEVPKFRNSLTCYAIHEKIVKSFSVDVQNVKYLLTDTYFCPNSIKIENEIASAKKVSKKKEPI